MEVRIGVQHVSREIVVETDAKPEDVEKTVAESFESGKTPVSYTHLTLPTNREV